MFVIGSPAALHTRKRLQLSQIQEREALLLFAVQLLLCCCSLLALWLLWKLRGSARISLVKAPIHRKLLSVIKSENKLSRFPINVRCPIAYTRHPISEMLSWRMFAGEERGGGRLTKSYGSVGVTDPSTSLRGYKKTLDYWYRSPWGNGPLLVRRSLNPIDLMGLVNLQ